MLYRSARVCVGAERRFPVLAAIASTLLLSSCGTFDLFHTAAPPAEVAPTALSQAEVAPPVDTTFWPTHGWRNSTPEAQGIDSAVLANALQTIRDRHIPVNSLLIERHGAVVLDAYF